MTFCSDGVIHDQEGQDFLLALRQVLAGRGEGGEISLEAVTQDPLALAAIADIVTNARVGQSGSLRLRPGKIQLGPRVINLECGLVTVGGQQSDRLPKMVCALLRLLAEGNGELISREYLALKLWGRWNVKRENLFKALLLRLRARVEDDPRKPQFVITVPGRGYMLRNFQRGPVE